MNQLVSCVSGFDSTLANFVIDASDQELFLGQEYGSLTNKRSCGQFQGVPVANAPNELLCLPGTVGRYVYMKTWHILPFRITEFEVYPRRE